MKHADTIIIGAGAAGLACARKLSKHAPAHNFIVISKDIGGRIATSDDGKVNYGAYFVMDFYKNVKEVFTPLKRVNPMRVAFHSDSGHPYRAIRALRHPIELLRLYKIVRKFRNHYTDFLREAEEIGQKQALLAHPELSSRYSQSAREFIREQRIENIVEKFVAQILYSFSFVDMEHLSALDLLRMSTVIITPTYSFYFDKDKAVASFRDRVILDEVVSVEKQRDTYVVRTKRGASFRASNLVVATEPTVTKKLLNIPKIKGGASAYITHLRGSIKKTSGQSKYYNAYSYKSDVIGSLRQEDGTYIFASKTSNVDLKQYFVNPEVISTKHWHPAFNIVVSDVIYEADRGGGLYMIGDYNIAGLEDAFVTGIFAANRIMKSTQL